MYCHNHIATEATAKCVSCKKTFCSDCMSTTSDSVCITCEIQDKAMMEANVKANRVYVIKEQIKEYKKYRMSLLIYALLGAILGSFVYYAIHDFDINSITSIIVGFAVVAAIIFVLTYSGFVFIDGKYLNTPVTKHFTFNMVIVYVFIPIKLFICLLIGIVVAIPTFIKYRENYRTLIKLRSVFHVD